jgi:hypothetical protein
VIALHVIDTAMTVAIQRKEQLLWGAMRYGGYWRISDHD